MVRFQRYTKVYAQDLKKGSNLMHQSQIKLKQVESRKCYILICRTNRSARESTTSFTYGVPPLQFDTSRRAQLGVGGVVFLQRQAGGRLGNRWRSLVAGRGWHQSRRETLTGNIHRLRLLLQPAEGETKQRSRTGYQHHRRKEERPQRGGIASEGTLERGRNR